MERMTISADLFREVFRHWASATAVVTSCDHNRPHGMVISSFSSLANDPPMVMFSAGTNSRMNAIVDQQGQFAVSILSAKQLDIFERFAGVNRTFDQNRFFGLQYATAITGMPIFPEGMAWVDCEVVNRHPGPGYTIFVGEIVAAGLGTASEEAPLVYYRRQARVLPYESPDPQRLQVDHSLSSLYTPVANEPGDDPRTIELISGG
jgi:flavin reductase (DIM6/NTAB) family NADH-FMN oxidoreductase RutF